MPKQFTNQRQFSVAEISGNSRTVFSAENMNKISATVTNGTTDDSMTFHIPSNVSAFGMIASQDMTVKTTDAVSPDETFNLTADVGVVYFTGDTAIFGGERFGIYVTNSSGSDGTLEIVLGNDATP